jgi:hypothetical protein
VELGVYDAVRRGRADGRVSVWRDVLHRTLAGSLTSLPLLSDVPLAYKTFLRAVEVATDPSDVESGRGSFSASASDDLDTILNESDAISRLWWWLKIVSL